MLSQTYSHVFENVLDILTTRPAKSHFNLVYWISEEFTVADRVNGDTCHTTVVFYYSHMTTATVRAAVHTTGMDGRKYCSCI